MSAAAFTPGQTGRPFGYGYQTWILPGRDPSFGLFGVRGQYILVDPARRLVMVNTAVRSDARDRGNADTFALWEGVRATLRDQVGVPSARMHVLAVASGRMSMRSMYMNCDPTRAIGASRTERGRPD